jgi:CubicO group peptidase (beta-lactamase class C family)
MSTRAFGHTGFTGTSLWVDPDRDMFVIVLTNAVHECRDGSYPRNAIVQDVRADVADIATLAVDAAADAPAEWRADRAIGWTRR